MMPGTPSRVVVIGVGASGSAAVHLATADGSQVMVTDQRPVESIRESVDALPAGTLTEFGGHPLRVLENANLVVLSPGVPPDSPLVLEARRQGLPVLSELEFAWSHRPLVPLAAVTGSNGKSTVTTLIAQMMNTFGMETVAGGNLGPPASELVLDDQWSSWVLEVSSFQSESLVNLRPHVAVFLNLSQDHLERHPDMLQYAEAKSRLFAFQRASDSAILNADDPLVMATRTEAQRRLFSISSNADATLRDGRLYIDGQFVIDSKDLRISGLHNIANALAASLAAQEMGVSIETIREVLGTFTGLPHRHRTVHEDGGIRWVDDSKATNVGATIAALGGYAPKSVHLILGGQGKGQDFSPLAEPVSTAAAAVYLIGRDAPIIKKVVENVAPVHDCQTLEVAVDLAVRHALPGQCVLLAPACASFDQFTDYADRGRAFERIACNQAAPCR